MRLGSVLALRAIHRIHPIKWLSGYCPPLEGRIVCVRKLLYNSPPTREGFDPVLGGQAPDEGVVSSQCCYRAALYPRFTNFRPCSDYIMTCFAFDLLTLFCCADLRAVPFRLPKLGLSPTLSQFRCMPPRRRVWHRPGGFGALGNRLFRQTERFPALIIEQPAPFHDFHPPQLGFALRRWTFIRDGFEYLHRK